MKLPLQIVLLIMMIACFALSMDERRDSSFEPVVLFTLSTLTMLITIYY